MRTGISKPIGLWMVMAAVLLFATVSSAFGSDADSETAAPLEDADQSRDISAPSPNRAEGLLIPANQLSFGDASAPSTDRTASSDGKPPVVPFIFATASKEFQQRIGISVSRPATLEPSAGSLVAGNSTTNVGGSLSTPSDGEVRADKELLTELEKQAKEGQIHDASELENPTTRKLLETLRKK